MCVGVAGRREPGRHGEGLNDACEQVQHSHACLGAAMCFTLHLTPLLLTHRGLSVTCPPCIHLLPGGVFPTRENLQLTVN